MVSYKIISTIHESSCSLSFYVYQWIYWLWFILKVPFSSNKGGWGQKGQEVERWQTLYI